MHSNPPTGRLAPDRGEVSPSFASSRAKAVCALIGPLVHKLSNTLLAVSGLAELAGRRPGTTQSANHLRLVADEAQSAVALLRSLADLAKPAGRELASFDAVQRISALGELLRPWFQERHVDLELRLSGEVFARWPERALEQGLLLMLVAPWLNSELGPAAAPGSSLTARRARLATRTRRGRTWLCCVLPLPAGWVPQAEASSADALPALLPELRSRDWLGPRGAWRAFALPLAHAAERGSPWIAPALPSTASASQELQSPTARTLPGAAGPLPSAGQTAEAGRLAVPGAVPGSPRRARLLLVGGPESQLTAEVLAEAGYAVEHARDLPQARRLLERLAPDLLLVEDPAGAAGFDWLRFSGEAQTIHGARLGQLGAGAGLPAPRLPAPVRPAELLAFVARLLAPLLAPPGPHARLTWHPQAPRPTASEPPSRSGLDPQG